MTDEGKGLGGVKWTQSPIRRNTQYIVQIGGTWIGEGQEGAGGVVKRGYSE